MLFCWIIDVRFRLRVEELPAQVQPGDRIGCERDLAVTAGAANAIGLKKVGEEQVLRENRAFAITCVVHSAGEELLIVLEPCAPFFQIEMKAAEFEAYTAMEVLEGVADSIRYRIFICVAHKRGDAGAEAGTPVVGEIGNDGSARKKIELKAADPVMCVVSALFSTMPRESRGSA